MEFLVNILLPCILYVVAIILLIILIIIGIRFIKILDKVDKVVDDVLVLKYVAPKSYTGEDMVETALRPVPTML